MTLLLRREGRDLREGRSPSLTTLPLPLLREGGQGDRLLNDPVLVQVISNTSPSLGFGALSPFNLPLIP